MCTLIALHRVVDEAPLVVAANRDEFLDRPAEGPALRDRGRQRAVTPLDLRAGGTWWGVGESGLFAAVTNRRGAPRDDSRRSRGFVVGEALRAGSAGEAARRLAALPARRFNPFHAFVADGVDAFALAYEDEPRCLALAPGVHVIGNVDPTDTADPKIARVRERARQAAAAGGVEAVLQALARTCSAHEDGAPGLGDTCIHLDGYGTRSSSLLAWDAAGRPTLLRHAEGHPCSAPYRDHSPLLDGLSQRASHVPGANPTRKAS